MSDTSSNFPPGKYNTIHVDPFSFGVGPRNSNFFMAFYGEGDKLIKRSYYSCAQFFYLYQGELEKKCTKIKTSVWLKYASEYAAWVKYLEYHFDPKTSLFPNLLPYFTLDRDSDGRPVSITLHDTKAVSKDEFICFITCTRNGNYMPGSVSAWQAAMNAGASYELAFIICHAIMMKIDYSDPLKATFSDNVYIQNSSGSGGNTLFNMNLPHSEAHMKARNFFTEEKKKRLSLFQSGYYQVNSRFTPTGKEPTLSYPADYYHGSKAYNGIFEAYYKLYQRNKVAQNPFKTIKELVTNLQQVEATTKKKAA